MESFLKDKNANEISKNETNENTGIRDLKNNVNNLKLDERNYLNFSVEKKNIIDENNVSKKSKIMNEQKNIVLKVENSSSNANSKNKSNEYKNIIPSKRQTKNHIIDKKKNNEKKKKKKKLLVNELHEKIHNKSNDINKETSSKVHTNETSEITNNKKEKANSVNKETEKDNKQIIFELKNTLNIVDNVHSSNKIDGLNSDEIKILDNWYFANKLKIIPCLFEEKPLNINLLNSLYSVHPYFKNNKSKIIIYLKAVKKKYENSLKESNKNEKEEKEKHLSANCKNTILQLLENNIENLKQKEYMAKFITLISSESNYVNLKYYFNFLLTSQIDIYEIFLDQNGLLCIKHILQKMAKNKLIKKNIVLLIHILNFLKILNITFNHLKSTLIGIPINFIARNKEDEQNNMDYRTNNETVINIAKELINRWKLIRDKMLSTKNVEQVNKDISKNVINRNESKVEKIENNLEKYSKNGTIGTFIEKKRKNEITNKIGSSDNNISLFKNNTENLNSVQLSSNYSKSIIKNDQKLINENKEKSKNTNATKSSESKNIMLEIIDTLNEEYEKKKKRHLEYKKAKIEGKIKRFSALKNNSENSKSDNLLADIRNISKLDFDHVLHKRIKTNDFTGINNNFSDVPNNMQNYNYNINKLNRNTINIAPFDKYKIKENYAMDTNLKNQNVNEFLKESYKNILHHHNINRNVQSHGNIKDKENRIDPLLYLNKYSTYDGDSMSSNYYSNSINNNIMNSNISNIRKKNDNEKNYMENEINNSSNMKNGNNMNYVNKPFFSNSAFYNINEKNINSNNYIGNVDAITPSKALKKKSSENFNNFSVKKTEYITKNSEDEKNYEFSSDTIYDPLNHVNKNSNKYSYNKSFENNNVPETNKLNDKNLFKDPFEYYSNNQQDLNEMNQIDSEGITNKIRDGNKNNASFNNNDYNMYIPNNYINYMQNNVGLNLYNNSSNVLNHQNTLQNKDKNSFINNNTILKEIDKNNILNKLKNSPNGTLNENEKNINSSNFYNSTYSNNNLPNSLDKNATEQGEVNGLTHVNSLPHITKKVDSNIIEAKEKEIFLNNVNKNLTNNNLLYNSSKGNHTNMKEDKENRSEYIIGTYESNNSPSLYKSNINDANIVGNNLTDNNMHNSNNNLSKVRNQEQKEDNAKTDYYNFENNISNSNYFSNEECFSINSKDTQKVSNILKDCSENNNRKVNEKNNKKAYVEHLNNNYIQDDKQKMDKFNNAHMKSNKNFLNTKERLDNSLNEIFKNFKNLENIKVECKIAITDNYYPSKIFDDVEVMKNDLIINFNYDKAEKVYIYLKNNLSNIEKNNSSRLKICNNSDYEVNHSCNKLGNIEGINEGMGNINNAIGVKNMNNINYINSMNNISDINNMNNISDVNNMNNINNKNSMNSMNNMNNMDNNFNILPLPELFNPPNLKELKLPFIPIISNLSPSPNMMPPIIFPYNNSNEYKEQSVNNIKVTPNSNNNSTFPSNNKLYRSFDEFIKIFDEDIQKILLKNTDLANLLMNKPDVVEKMLKGPQYINEALSSLEEELKNWNKSNLNS